MAGSAGGGRRRPASSAANISSNSNSATGDPQLRPRLREYLEQTNPPVIRATATSIDAAVSFLVARHGSCARRPRSVLKASVTKEMTRMLQQQQPQQTQQPPQQQQAEVPFRHRHPDESAQANSGSEDDSALAAAMSIAMDPDNGDVLDDDSVGGPWSESSESEAEFRGNSGKSQTGSRRASSDSADYNLLNAGLRRAYAPPQGANGAAISMRKRRADGPGAVGLNQPTDAVGDVKAPKAARVVKRRRTRTVDGEGDSGKGGCISPGTNMTAGRRASRADPGVTDFAPIPLPNFGYEVLGGIESVLEIVRDVIETPMLHPEIFEELGCRPSVGVLLHGPSGCGKTLLASAIAGELGRKMALPASFDTSPPSTITKNMDADMTDIGEFSETVGNGTDDAGVAEEPLEAEVAATRKLSFFRVSAPELVSGLSGESESNIRRLFAAAIEHEPSIVFLDEIDTICQKRGGHGKAMEERIVASLLTCFDDLAVSSSELPEVLRNSNAEGEASADVSSSPRVRFRRVLILAATNRLDAIDPSLRRTGRFDREIPLGVPDINARAAILRVQAISLKLRPTPQVGDVLSDDPNIIQAKPALDFLKLAKMTPGYVGADCQALAKEAVSIVVRRTASSENRTLPADAQLSRAELDRLCITQADFEAATKLVQPTAKREGFATIPDVSWDDVGALEDIRAELRLCVLEPIKRPERFAAAGLDAPTGVLLYGPPGCGKTLLAKAIASDCNAGFISVKGPELLNKYVGESEAAVRRVFERARLSKPCIIFFDELDALCPRRDDSDGGNSATKRVVNQLLTEMDGFGTADRRGIFIIAATNRPDIIDPAMLRPQRLDKLLYVPLPDETSRLNILETCARKHGFAQDIDLAHVAARTAHYSGADLAALVRESVMLALEEVMREEDSAHAARVAAGADAAEDQRAAYPPLAVIVRQEHLGRALEKIPPSVSAEDEVRYQLLGVEFGRGKR